MKQHRLLITLLLIVAVVQAALAGNKIRIMTQNVENFFYQYQPDNVTSENDQGYIKNLDIAYKLANREAKMEALLKAYFREGIPVADIYCFNEIECSDDILNYIAQNFQEKTGIEFAIIQDGLATYTSDGGIIRKSGYIYNPSVVKPYGTSMATGTGTVYTRFMRMQAFEEIASGERFTLSVNHFKAGNQSDTDYTNENAQRRLDNANDLLSALPNALDPDILIVGDLNSYMPEPCLQKLVANGYEEQIFRFDPNAYAAGWGVGNFIDHVFANSTMAEQVTSAKFYYVATQASLDVIPGYAYSDHDPYMVEVELKHYDVPTYSFTKATSVKAGGQYLIAAQLKGNLEIAKPIPTNNDYGYLYTSTVTEENGVITLENTNNVFTFEDAGDGKFYIKDSNGRYFYQNTKTGGYYFTVGVTADKTAAHTYTPTLQTDGTFKIVSTQSGHYIYGTVYNNTTPEFCFTSYASLSGSNYRPWLYEYDPSIVTGIETVNNSYSQATVTRKVLENGRFVIVAPNGSRYNVQGIEIK